MGFGNPFGSTTTMGVAPATRFGLPASTNPKAKVNTFSEDEPLDKRVIYFNAKESQLKDECSAIRNQQKKCMDYFLGLQTFSARRPRWMHRIIDNASFLTVERWSALLTDNKPKIVFAAFNPKDQSEADIANAAFLEDYTRNGFQAALEDAVKLSRIEKKAYIRQYYDPVADEGRGQIKWMAVSGTQVYVNAEARNIDEATILMYEYVEPTSKVLARWKHLESKLRDDTRKEKDRQGLDYKISPAARTIGIQSESMIPGAQPGEVAGATTYNTPYGAKTSPPQQSTQGGTRIREWWLKHPTKKTKVKRIVWTLGGEPATEPKMIQFYNEDGSPEHKEPLMTVVTEGNVVYEWPLSTALLTEYIGTHYGGLKVLSMSEARKVITEKKEVELYPNGRRVVLAENEIASDGANPFEYWPFVEIDAHRTGNSYYGLSDIDIIMPLQDAKNRLTSQLMDAAHMTANPLWRLPSGRKTPNEMITNAPGAIIDEDLPSLRYGKREKGPEMPAYLMQLLQYYDQRIEMLTGVTPVGMGGKTKGNQAAETVSMYQDAASLPARQGIRNVEQALTKLGYQWKSLAAQFYSGPRWVLIKDSVGEDTTKLFIGTTLTAPMTIEAKAGSMQPQSPTARFAAAMQMMQTPYGTMEQWFEALAEVGYVDSASAAIKNVYKHVDSFVLSRSEQHPMGDPAKLVGMPGLLQILAGGSQKKAPSNAGRSARARTPRTNG